MGYLDRELPQGWVLHPVSALRQNPARSFSDHAIAAMRDRVVRDRAEHFRALAANEDMDLRNEYAEAYDSYIRALDWALTTLNREIARRTRRQGSPLRRAQPNPSSAA
jgi:hypothetical protein